ncbi:MAG: NUDIX domain-containing protein [Allosphingosinicella sp.]
MPPRSAGILLYRRRGGALEVLLVHPGGPFWKSRDDGAWMIPKGGVEEGEAASACALREFEEELGSRPAGTPWPLCTVRQKGGKLVEAFALEGDLDPAAIVSNSFRLEYPPRSGLYREFPEVDAAAWYGLSEARTKILPSQAPILNALEAALGGAEPPGRRDDA